METHSVEAGHNTGLLLWARNKSSKKEPARHVPDTGRGNSKRHQCPGGIRECRATAFPASPRRSHRCQVYETKIAA